MNAKTDRSGSTLGRTFILALLFAGFAPVSGHLDFTNARGEGALFAQSSQGRSFYVSPAGNPTSDGSIGAPLDLATALSSKSPAHAGDTVWLRAGTYKGAFTSVLTGTAAAPIVVRQYPGERATIDSSPSLLPALQVSGSYVWFWGFEIMDSSPTRLSAESGSWPDDIGRGEGIFATSPGIKIINMVIHDMSDGIGLWQESPDGEAYGNIIFNNGWFGPDRGHGHGIYTQNQTGSRRVADNIIFDQFSHGIHGYASSAAPNYLNNITVEGNIVFNSGILSGNGDWTRDILVGGGTLAQNPVVQDNSTYGLAQINMGYAAGCSNGVMQRNYVVGTGVFLPNCNPIFQANTIYSIYSQAPLPTLYPNNTYYSQRPTGLVVRVRPNQYEPGRAQIAVYNWDHLPAVSVDISAAQLAPGATFEIRDAENFFGSPVVTGTYTGAPVVIPMTGLTAVPPIGGAQLFPGHTAPEFGAFVVLPTTTTTSTKPTVAATLTATPNTITTGGSASLSWSSVGATSLSLDQGIGSVATTGALTVNPAATTTYTLTAQSADGRTTTSSASVTVNSPANVPPTASLTAPGNGAVYTAPATIALAASASDSDGTVAKVEFYQGGSLIGTATASPYTASWSPVAAGTYTITARAYDNLGATTSSNQATIVVNAPPSVSLVAPAANAPFTAPAAITLTASASDSDGSIAKVEFYQGTTLIGTSTSNPFSVSWTNVAAGTYSLTARAYDNRNASTLSAAVSVTVGASAPQTPNNQPPTVILTNPNSYTTYNAGTPLTLSAQASDSDGTISRVDFYQGATLLGTATGPAPSNSYSFTWANPPGGTFSVTARAYDNQGASTASAATTVTVNALPVVSPASVTVLNAPGAPADLILSATATDPDGTVLIVEFWAGGSLLNRLYSGPTYSTEWKNMAPGTYSITVKAYDNHYAISTSAPITVTIAH